MVGKGGRLTPSALVLVAACATGGGDEGVPSDIGQRPVFNTYTDRPELVDSGQALAAISRAVETHYPGGRAALCLMPPGQEALVFAFVDTTGTVANTQIQRSSADLALDQAAEAAVREFSFTPARNRADKVAVWTLIPLDLGRVCRGWP